MITMVANPHDWIAGQGDSRASGKKKLEPLRHFKAAMGQIPMQIKCRADSAPEKDYQHNGQVRKVETMEKAEHAQNLQSNQYNKNQQMEFFVFKHAAEEKGEKEKRKQPTGPQLNQESQRSHENEEGASRYFLKAILQFEARSVHDELDPSPCPPLRGEE